MTMTHRNRRIVGQIRVKLGTGKHPESIFVPEAPIDVLVLLHICSSVKPWRRRSGTCCSPWAVCQTNTTRRSPRRIFVTHVCTKLLGTSLQSCLFADLLSFPGICPLPVVNMLCPPHLQPAWPVRTVAYLLHTWRHSLFQSRRL